MCRRSITCFASKFFARLDHTTLDDTKFKTYPTVFNNLNIACSKQLHENLLTVKSRIVPIWSERLKEGRVFFDGLAKFRASGPASKSVSKAHLTEVALRHALLHNNKREAPVRCDHIVAMCCVQESHSCLAVSRRKKPRSI